MRNLLTFVLAASALLASTAGLAEETICDGSLGAVAVDNLLVPDGADCALRGTSVAGTVQVGTGASLKADGIAVVGNVQAEGADPCVCSRAASAAACSSFRAAVRC